ncbi:hypothetical protein Taro_055774 [Colocasia esculenta]|uniref:Uncharacterized protein n=1 Tax=Colocasia esculenta TaxID=4460 RepID=A0A843XRT7_COLES|nr:hypothetical protein [Colocasia esculenta]
MTARGRGSTFFKSNICLFKGGNLSTLMLDISWKRSLTRRANLPARLASSSDELSDIRMDIFCGNIGGGFRDLFRESSILKRSIFGVFCLTPAFTMESSCFPRNHCRAEKRFEVGIFGTYLSREVVGGVPSRRTRTFSTITDLSDLEMAAGGLLKIFEQHPPPDGPEPLPGIKGIRRLQGSLRTRLETPEEVPPGVPVVDMGKRFCLSGRQKKVRAMRKKGFWVSMEWTSGGVRGTDGRGVRGTDGRGVRGTDDWGVCGTDGFFLNVWICSGELLLRQGVLVEMFEGQSKVRLLPLGRLRSRKTKNSSLPHRKGRRPGHCRDTEGVAAYVAFILGALRFWVRRRQKKRRNQNSDIPHVAIRFPPQRRSLSRPYIPCVRLEHSLEGLRKSPLTMDSHTVAGLVVPVAT